MKHRETSHHEIVLLSFPTLSGMQDPTNRFDWEICQGKQYVYQINIHLKSSLKYALKD